MNKIEDLHTLIRLLAEFEFPVSPILEYAIKNKEEELKNNVEKPIVIKQKKATKQKPKLKVTTDYSDKPVTTKKKPTVIRVYRPNGTYILEANAGATMCKAIEEIGVEKVYELRIPLDGMYLVTKGGNPQYPTAQCNVGNDMFVNVHSNTITKKRQLERIFKSLNLDWRVEIIDTL